MTLPRSLASAAVSLAIVSGTATGTAFANEAVIGARQAQFTLFQHNLGILGGMARGTIEYDAALASVAAGNLATVASQDQGTFWIPGTDTASAEGTRALPAIWEDPDDFAAKFSDLQAATRNMADVAGSDLATLQANIGSVTSACSACHQSYRQPE